MLAHAHPGLTVGPTGRGWSRLDVLLRELSQLLGEAVVAMQLGFWPGAGGTLGPEGGFILQWGGPFTEKSTQSTQGVICPQPPTFPPYLALLSSLLASYSCDQRGPSLGLVAALCPVKHKGKKNVTVMATHSHRVCPHL